MNIFDKTLYHQIHPFKLTTDVITSFAAVYLLWEHLIIEGLVMAFVPSLVISLFMLKLMDFEKQKQSKFGKYLKKYMGRGTDIVRSIGFLIMLVGGWFHFLWAVALGFLVVILSWTHGLLFKKESPLKGAGGQTGRRGRSAGM